VAGFVSDQQKPAKLVKEERAAGGNAVLGKIKNGKNNY
jgi:hypothetical protein